MCIRDRDYMLLAFAIEAITGKGLDAFLKETFWDPMGLSLIHISFYSQDLFKRHQAALPPCVCRTRPPACLLI